MSLWLALRHKMTARAGKKTQVTVVLVYHIDELLHFKINTNTLCRIMERAYKLRDERERVRNEHVKSSLDKQWRDACDDARTLDSEALLRLVSQQRQDQIEKKVALNQKLTAEEREHTAAWLKHVEAMEKIEVQKDIDRVTNERQTASLISLQVNDSFMFCALY